ncbi:MAG: tetratricopeptide repeat protein [Bryobacteraceae bacterium]
MGRLFFSVLGGTMLLGPLVAQPCLVHGGVERVGTLESFSGPVQPKLTPAEPAPGVAIALFPGWIAEERRASMAAELTALYKAAGKTAPLTLLVFNGEGFAASGPFETSLAWRNAVRKALAPVDAATPAPATASLYSAIMASVAAFGGNWSSVILAGPIPELDADTRDYARTRVSSSSCGQKLRVSYWNPEGSPSTFWASVSDDTGGAAPADKLTDLLESLGSGPWTEVAWPAAPLCRGFLLYGARLLSQTPGAPAVELPVLAAAPGAVLPTLEQYAELLDVEKQISELGRMEKPDAAQVQQMHALLERALTINARDAVALRVGADYYRRANDYQTAANLLDKLAEIQPRSADLQAELGHCRFVAGDLDAAESALRKAHDGKAGGPVASEELARIRLARHDDRGALPFLEETLALDARKTELWFTRADVAGRLGDQAKVADSLEKGLALEPGNLGRRTALVELYLDSGAGEKALGHIRIVTADLPADASVRRRYAEYLDRLNRPDESLSVWKKAIEADPAVEPAHFRVARLLLDRGAVADSLAAAEAGLTAAPKSARLYLVKAEGLERQQHFFDARQTLRRASKSIEDVALLARLAEMEDSSGWKAPEAYKALLIAREKAAPGTHVDGREVERGLEVAVRDGDAESAAFFRARLNADGKSAVSNWLAESAAKSAAGATVPGGLEALAFMAHFHVQSPQTFFASYSRTLVDKTDNLDPKSRNLYLADLRRYFQELADLKAVGVSKGNSTEVVVSAADKKSLGRSERALGILGWKLKVNKGEVQFEAGEKSSQAQRQETASALALDTVGIEDTLKAGKAFTIEIADESAPVLLDESAWMGTFFAKSKFNGGFAEALASDLRVAKTYAALSSISQRAVAALTAGSDLKTMAEKHADLLYRHGSAFALRGDRAAVPGGEAAEPIWTKLVGAAPASPNRFFHALLEKDDGKLLAFFATLGQVDVDHQRFFTHSLSRTTRFYELFRDSGEMAAGAEKGTRNFSFTSFLREVPIDSELRVLFPGSPEVWTVAKGNSSSVSKTAKMVKKLSRVTAPEQEDEILIRLAKTRYKLAQENQSELDHFIAVVRIDQHRSDPLDEASALLLAQNYGPHKAFYPYFAVLTGLGREQFEHFFALADQLHSMPRFDLNVILGEFDSLIALISLAQESGALDAPAAAGLFDQVCVRFSKANSPAGYTTASLDSVRELIQRAAPKPADGDPDRALERALLGAGPAVSFELDGSHREVDASAARSAQYRKVLRLQKVTSLKTLLDFYDRLQDLAQGRGAAMEHANALDALRAGLLTVEPPKKVKPSEVDRRVALGFEEAKTAELIVHLKQRLAKKKVNQKDVEQLVQELEAVICPHVKLALSGAVYAYFLSPDDLLVSQDPLLLRKHQFLKLNPGEQSMFTPSDLYTNNDGLGSYLEGGFADFPITAGKVAFSGSEPPANTGFLAAAQMGALRATDWSRLSEQDLIVFGLRLRLAREWVLHAGADATLLAGLEEDTHGLLSPTRRGELLDAIAARDWSGAFKSVTLGDLYSLSQRYLERYPADAWQSPVTAALRRVADPADDTRFHRLGASAAELQGCSHPHLAAAGPYEEYEKLLLPYKLAQRSAEFKLYVADFAGRTGIPPAALNALGQPIALQAVKRMKMADMYDWRGALLAFANLDEAAVAAALPEEK